MPAIPVIGDWIRVGTDEGDVKRISVRSTEIALADHSTLIVPNSELITKSVLNKTLASPLGRIQVQFSVPLESEADKVRTIVAQAFADEPFLHLLPEDTWPTTAATLGANSLVAQVTVDERAGRLIAVAAIDNLTKGTAGGAIQSTNLALGLPETTGLTTIGVAP